MKIKRMLEAFSLSIVAYVEALHHCLERSFLAFLLTPMPLYFVQGVCLIPESIIITDFLTLALGLLQLIDSFLVSYCVHTRGL